ncbi:MAG: aspartate--tRNA ligase [Nitrospirota bacterium]|nr:aspartate--tRNA ligase [Nitrospirota bacterium]
MPSVFRTHYAGELSLALEGEVVTVSGWVKRIRDHGGLVFLEVWDRSGLVQVVADPTSADYEPMKQVRLEYVVKVEGQVKRRPSGTENLQHRTGDIEIRISKLTVLNACKPLPFLIEDNAEVQENVRLLYRYLDLRRPRMIENLRVRHSAMQATRKFLSDNGFMEVETPILTKSTPEGARDFLVPSRLTKGHFYALPQSPQLFKQLLMVAGFDRYFQIARCFRDEDLRADRQPEFTQIDIEASFLTLEEFLDINERLVEKIFGELGIALERPFRRISYKDAIETYGTDKPDVRFGMHLKDLSAVFSGSSLEVFRKAMESGGVIKGLKPEGLKEFSPKEQSVLEEMARSVGLGGLTIVRREGGTLKGRLTRHFSEAETFGTIETLGLGDGEWGILAVGPNAKLCTALSQVRLYFRDKLGLVPAGSHAFLWVIDFPLLEYDEAEGRFVSMHHPFTAPMDEDIHKLEQDPLTVRAKAYDMVLDGNEIGGGSMRIYNAAVQERVFSLLAISKEEARQKFGFLLDALAYGAPPHGGIAYGLDRIVTLVVGASSIRDVIAFPKTQKGTCLMTQAPSPVSEDQLQELGIQLVKSKAEAGGLDV